MLLLNKKIFRAAISVYDGISPALLATISLSQNIKGKNHVQLVNSLKSSNIVQSKQILKSLISLDRSIFSNEDKIYQNRPSKISKGQCMTDIFTHSIILSNIQPHLKNKDSLKILDIGTGHGYLAFAIWNLAQELAKKPKKVLGVDCFQECIEKCNQIKKKLQINSDELEFRKIDVNQLTLQNQKFDIIVGGFFMQPNLSNKLQTLLQDEGLGIWPQQSESGQGLFVTRKGKSKEYLVQTLFSQQVVQSSVQQYFISDHEQHDQPSQADKKIQVQQDQKVKLQRMRSQKNEKKNKLQQELKQAIQKYQTRLNLKFLSLKQMQKIQEINTILQQLKKYK